MTRADLTIFIIGAKWWQGRWDLDDNTYDTVSTTFVIEAWEAWVESLPSELRIEESRGGKMVALPRYIPEVFDCDNAAADFAVFIDRCLAVDAVKTGNKRGNTAGGVINFLRNGTDSHARNWFLDHDGHLTSFDAGDGYMYALTDIEKASITAGRTL